MTKDDLIKRLQDIEWEDFEIKSCKSKLSTKVWETVSAFSNTAGGWLIFGVEQKFGQYIFSGVDKPEELEQNFTTVLRGEKFNRKIETKGKKYNFNGVTILSFYIPQKTPKERPVYFGSQYNTYIRSGSGDQRATKEEIEAMYRNSSFVDKDSELLSWGMEAIDQETLRKYRNYFQNTNPGHYLLQYSDTEFLSKLRVLENGKITIGGLLVFGKEDYIAKQSSSYRIDYLEIAGTSYTSASNRYKYRLTSESNLFTTFFDIYPKLIKTVDIPFELTAEGIRNENQPHVEALREALVNLLIHSDYFSKGSPRVRVFSDRIEFFNHGGLPKDLDYILKQDFTLPRNPIVAKCFRFIQLAENIGSGFHKMIDGWYSHYNVRPEIQGDFDYYTISFSLEGNEKSLKIGENSLPSNREGNENGNEKGSEMPLKQASVRSSKTESMHDTLSRKRWIMKQIKTNGKVRTREIQDFFKVSKKTVLLDINQLIESGELSREGKSSNTYYTFRKE